MDTREWDAFGPNGPKGIASINPPDVSRLDACTEDARNAALDGDPGPADPTSFFPLRGRLQAVRTRLPPLYRSTFVEPFIATLDQLGEPGFVQLMLEREDLAAILFDMAQAILQQGESRRSGRASARPSRRPS